MDAKTALKKAAEDMPSARFVDEEAAWQGDPWATLRQAAKSGLSCEEESGSPVAFSWDDPTGGRKEAVIH